MKLAVIGATGRAGSRILAEAKRRQHDVTAIVRDTGKLTDQSVSVLEKDVLTLTEGDLEAFDVVVNAFGTSSSQAHLHLKVAQHLVLMLTDKIKPRLLIVGGAGSLLVDNQGTKLIHTPDFPISYLATAIAMSEELDYLNTVNQVNWTFLSPSAVFEPGARTGHYRLGENHLLTDAQGQSHISMEDYAIAMLDEIENAKHVQKRFTVGY